MSEAPGIERPPLPERIYKPAAHARPVNRPTNAKRSQLPLARLSGTGYVQLGSMVSPSRAIKHLVEFHADTVMGDSGNSAGSLLAWGFNGHRNILPLIPIGEAPHCFDKDSTAASVFN